MFSNREASVRIAKWVSELSEFYIDFERRTAIKSQILADFIADWISPPSRRNLRLKPGSCPATGLGATTEPVLLES